MYSVERTVEEGPLQTADYMDLCGSVDEGHFIIFARTQELTWDEPSVTASYEHAGRTIIVWGMRGFKEIKAPNRSARHG